MAKTAIDLLLSLETPIHRGRWGNPDENDGNIEFWRASELQRLYSRGFSLSTIAEMNQLTIEEVEKILKFAEINSERALEEIRERLAAWDKDKSIAPPRKPNGPTRIDF